jgi:hypothetical protein
MKSASKTVRHLIAKRAIFFALQVWYMVLILTFITILFLPTSRTDLILFFGSMPFMGIAIMIYLYLYVLSNPYVMRREAKFLIEHQNELIKMYNSFIESYTNLISQSESHLRQSWQVHIRESAKSVRDEHYAKQKLLKDKVRVVGMKEWQDLSHQIDEIEFKIKVFEDGYAPELPQQLLEEILTDLIQKNDELKQKKAQAKESVQQMEVLFR